MQRLRLLFHARFLEVQVGKLSEENVYALGPAGRQWAQSEGIPLRRVPAGQRDHFLEIVSVWSALAAAIKDRDGSRLKTFRPDVEIREAFGTHRLPVIPDALAVIERQGIQDFRLAIEVDRDTERHGQLRDKLDGYRVLRVNSEAHLGWPDFQLVVVLSAGSARRAEAVRTLLKTRWPWPSLVIDRPAWPESLLAVVDQHLPTDSSCSKKSQAGEGPDVTTSSVLEEVEHSRTDWPGARSHD